MFVNFTDGNWSFCLNCYLSLDCCFYFPDVINLDNSCFDILLYFYCEVSIWRTLHDGSVDNGILMGLAFNFNNDAWFSQNLDFLSLNSWDDFDDFRFHELSGRNNYARRSNWLNQNWRQNLSVNDGGESGLWVDWYSDLLFNSDWNFRNDGDFWSKAQIGWLNRFNALKSDLRELLGNCGYCIFNVNIDFFDFLNAVWDYNGFSFWSNRINNCDWLNNSNFDIFNDGYLLSLNVGNCNDSFSFFLNFIDKGCFDGVLESIDDSGCWNKTSQSNIDLKDFLNNNLEVVIDRKLCRKLCLRDNYLRNNWNDSDFRNSNRVLINDGMSVVGGVDEDSGRYTGSIVAFGLDSLLNKICILLLLECDW